MSKNINLGPRLQAAMEAGALTPADLSRWFGRGYQTIYSWVYYGREPQASWRGEVYRRLVLLEKAIRRAKGPLVPYDVKQKDRAKALEQIYRKAA